VPEDGKTRIFIHIAEGTPDNRLTFYLRFTASTANNTTVDWGDETVETLGDTTATNYPHKYAGSGDYIIVMTVNSGTISFMGDNSNRIYGSSDNKNKYNQYRITKIIFGDNVKIGKYSFFGCVLLKSIRIPDGATDIQEQSFASCYSISEFIMPNTITNIYSNSLQYNHSLTTLTIPENVTFIGTNVFNNCHGMSEYHFKPTTPPTLPNTNAFNGIPSDCIIYVPQGSLNAYKTATNWSSYSSRIQEEPT